MDDWLDLGLGILCAYRLTQLVVWDGISAPVVSWFSERSSWFERLLGCAHCAGFWCSLLTVVALWLWRGCGWWFVGIGVWTYAIAGAVSLIEHATQWLASSDGNQKEPESFVYTRRVNTLD